MFIETGLMICREAPRQHFEAEEVGDVLALHSKKKIQAKLKLRFFDWNSIKIHFSLWTYVIRK